MSTSNYPSASPNSEAPQKDNKSIIYISIIAILLGVVGYMMYANNKKASQLEQKIAEYGVLDSAKTQVQQEFDEALLRLDVMTSNNTRLDSLVKSKDNELNKMKSRIRQLVGKQNASQKDLAEAKKLIDELNAKIDSYLAEIERLQNENQSLTQEKNNLTSQNNALKDTLNSTQKARAVAEEKVDMANTLHASNFSILPINVKRKGKEHKTVFADRADKIRISFDLDENMVAPSGTKELFILVTDSKGNLMSTPASGTFNARKEGDLKYTIISKVEYETSKKKSVIADINKTTEFEMGKYTIQVYHNGFKIGESSVLMR
ncbi:MAG: hypothetical protein ACO29O_01095 [Chitinophagaceae bacterium]